MNFTFFSSAHGTFSRIDHILGHKSSLGKFKKIEIIPSIFSDHNAVRLDLNYRRKTIKNSNVWRLNNTLLNNQQTTEEIKKEINPEYSLEGLMLKLQYFGHLMWRSGSLEKTLMLGKIEGRKRRGQQDEMIGWHHRLSGHEFEQTPFSQEEEDSRDLQYYNGLIVNNTMLTL